MLMNSFKHVSLIILMLSLKLYLFQKDENFDESKNRCFYEMILSEEMKSFEQSK
jgi:hypothetical protein